MRGAVPSLGLREVVGLLASGIGSDMYLRVQSEASGIVGRMSYGGGCWWEEPSGNASGWIPSGECSNHNSIPSL